MKPLTERVRGRLYVKDDNHALLLDDAAGDLFLRYALIVRGTGELVFPALLLDDWGRERKSLSLYSWIFEEGQRFPRAELFGFSGHGQETQIFLRDLEIFFKYPLHAYPNRKASVESGRRVQTVLIPDAQQNSAPEPIQVPASTAWPLRHASVEWRRVHPDTLEAYGYRPLPL